jgi:hypothetical protein
MVDYALCVNGKCQYKNTCWRWLKKPGVSPDDRRHSYSHFDWNKNKGDCYIPVDGKVL